MIPLNAWLATNVEADELGDELHGVPSSPDRGLRFYVRVGTSTEASPCSYLGSAGVEGRVGIDASLLGLTLADEEKRKDL